MHTRTISVKSTTGPRLNSPEALVYRSRKRQTDMRILLTLSAVVTLIVLAACTSSGPAVAPPAPSSTDSVTVHVLNQNYWDATIYWIYEGELRRRLGIVRGNQNEGEFRVPWSPKMLAFEIDLIVAGGVYLSQHFSVSPGGYVDLTLPANLQSSGFFRRIGS